MQACTGCPHFVKEICSAPPLTRPTRCDNECLIARRDATLTAAFERYHRHVVAWACRMSGNYELGRDLAQDVFVKAWNGWDRFRGQAQFSTWLYTITRNCWKDYVKARASRPREVDDSVLTIKPPVVENAAIASLEAQHAIRLVRRLIRDAHLDAVETRAFRLHYGAGVPLGEITVRLGLHNRSGARAHLVSATRKLRRSAARIAARDAARGAESARIAARYMSSRDAGR